MAKKTKKPQVIPVILGAHPTGEQKKNIIALHYHPEAIKALVHELKEGMKEDVPSYNLLTDVEVLVHWALKRLPLVPPPDKKEPASDKSDTDSKTD